jgi:adenylate cyclase
LQLFKELQRRNVFRVGTAYVVASWLLIQVTETILPLFGFADSTARTVVIILGVGFIPTLVLAWAFEITPEGVKKERDVDRSISITPQTGKKLDRAIIIVLILALGYFTFDKFILSQSRETSMKESARLEGRSDAIIESYGEQSIAVLPFVDMSQEGDQEYFSDGISEELLNLLAKIPELRVISRSSAFSYKGKDINLVQVARELNVANILEGSVRKAGDQVRITVQLIEARSDTHLWSETYDRTLEDIFSVQDEISAAVVAKLKVILLGAPPKVDVTDAGAYTLFLQAEHLVNTKTTEESLKNAASLYKEVLLIDPEYVPAWLGLSRAYNRSIGIKALPVEETKALLYDALEQALLYQPESSEALSQLAWNKFKNDGDYQSAAKLFERAYLSDPTNTKLIGNISIFLTSLGRQAEGISFAEYQIARDPANSIAQNNLGIRYRYAKQFEKAEKAFKTAMTLDSSHAGLGYELGATYLLAGDYAAASAAFEEEPFQVFQQIGLVMSYHALNEQARSDELLEELISSYGERIAYYIAQMMAVRGQIDEAYEWLEKAHSAGEYEFDNVVTEPLLDNLRSDPGWLPFLRRVGKAPEQLERIKFDVALPE